MSARSLVLGLGLCVGAAAPLLGQVTTQLQPQVENSKFQAVGAINGNGVLVRSGPGENYYPTVRLEKGTMVTVVGHKFDWLKVMPPEGSFSVVAKQFVAREAGSETGRITADVVNIRAGSVLNQLRATVQCKLKRDEVVTIVGEDDAYYQIKPPAEAYVYVHQKYVDLVKLSASAPQPAGEVAMAKPRTTEEATAANTNPPTESVGAATEGVGPATQPAGSEITALVPVPATQPVAKAQDAVAPFNPEAEYDRLEGEWAAMQGKGLDEQPIAELLGGYEKVLASGGLPISMRRVAEVRVLSLKVKKEAQDEVLAMRQRQAEAAARLEAIRANRQALEQKMASGTQVYSAVGTLQASTLQVGNETLYRLTDPATGRAVCYVRSNDPAYVKLMGQFIGVKGEVITDPQLNLKVVVAAEHAVVDPAQVNKTALSQIMPPSLLIGSAKKESASTE